MAATSEVEESTVVHLGDLLDEGKGAVVTLVAGETRLVAHRAVLVTRSPVFASMFQHDTLEVGSSLVNITDMEGPVLRELLTYMYTLRAPRLASMAPQLLTAADKYCVSSLKAQCEQQLATALAVDNAAATAVLAVRHCCPGLRQTAISYIKGHTYQVMATQGWADAVRTQPEDVVELSRLLAETPPEPSAPAAAVCGPSSSSSSSSSSTQPHSDHGGTPAVTAQHTPTPPEDAAVSRLRSLPRKKRAGRLIEAAKVGAVEQLRALLAAGADVMVREESSWTALHWAAYRGHVGAASCLVGAGAEVGARSRKQSTPLHWAAYNGHTAVVRLLLAAYADPNVRDRYGRTPLHWAVRNVQAEVVAVLLQAGADRAGRDDMGRTPVELAMNNQELVDMLKDRFL
ncbi:putative ankyrin-containing lipoprotein Lxx09580 isoform X8 [Schistocerca gregaria]|nr:putative ankyrin-containing lipoprotein Lxx09580 isoform X8 [Schistocerca gregaria]